MDGLKDLKNMAMEPELGSDKSLEDNSRNAIYLLRTVQQHHVQLSMMADNKAGVLLGASFVSLTILGAWAGSGQAQYAAIILAISILLTAFFSVLALIPRSGPTPGRNDSPSESRNLLFFGVFAQMPYSDFEAEIFKILKSDRKVFEAMIRDIYSMGVVQHQKKYKFIRYSYLSFLGGLIAAPLTALLELLLNLF